MTRLDGFSATSLVGRDDELRRLQQAVDGARGGRGAAIFIEGALGVGKTRLGRDLVEHAERNGATCLTATAFAVETRLPYSLFLTALDTFDRLETAGRV